MALNYLWNRWSVYFPLQLLFASFSDTPRSSIPLSIVVDWDGTLTKKDTLHIVAAIGYDYNHDSALTPWDDIVEAYLVDYSQYENKYEPSTEKRRTIPEESTWLASLKDVEERSVQRVQEAGIFNGVTHHDICEASISAIRDEKIQLRNGWKQLLASADGPVIDRQKHRKVSILSVNWSATFIRDCLRNATTISQSENDILECVPICANEIHTHVPSIRTSADKLAAFKKIRDDTSRTLYLGDSATDFDCLIAADVGICVRDEPMGSSQRELKETLERIGIVVSRLGPEAWKTDGMEETNMEGKGPVQRIKRVWWINDLFEAVKFIDDRNSV
jgi:2-hydroxy-3-keto-5-methylthiopentenyl-1-phosphate phosphatase